MSESNGNGRIHLLNDHNAARGPKTDTQGRVLKHNASVADVHAIVAEECAKVHEYYLNQIPPFVARMIQDALMSYGLIKLETVEGGEPQIVPTPESAEAPAEPPHNAT